MQANWSLILNVLLLIGVIVAIGRLMKARRQGLKTVRQPTRGRAEANPAYDGPSYGDDIIAVRKLNAESAVAEDVKKNNANPPPPRLIPEDEEPVLLNTTERAAPRIDIGNLEECEQETAENATGPTLMMFLLAKESRQFAGYELLQTVLAAGLRFGDDGLFHRHQFTNGDGPVICSLAAATATGIFDLQNIGAFTVRGLCLYMQATNNPKIDAQRFATMLDTARQLSDGLDAHLLDEQRRPLTEERILRYQQTLNLNSTHLEAALA
ncbi:cell division protein ZipA C-terminal FtsZ-binding domain-containing protein [Legionella saoudiensis]|uniref:cell division protein ZipA C-terminal FtsZ-binding domain-containing protein n=1 Tax=Legionella saoudiensis TaxID=1750561 RepID=UPI000730AD53|nr:cell division protein ZipA C-terminal FtsZ-binding domain-containing protein [Legionella saoudiensis]